MHCLPLSLWGYIVFLTSNPGIEGNAHTAVGVIGLHGNFPCTPGPVTETEREEDINHTLRQNMHRCEWGHIKPGQNHFAQYISNLRQDTGNWGKDQENHSAA